MSPHVHEAAPLRAVDDVLTEVDGELYRITATKRVDPDDPYMAGHYPGQPIYPGVFVLETLGQAVTVALGGNGVGLRLAELVSVRFTAPLLAGDVLSVHALASPSESAGTWQVRATCLRSDQRRTAQVTARYRTMADRSDHLAGRHA